MDCGFGNGSWCSSPRPDCQGSYAATPKERSQPQGTLESSTSRRSASRQSEKALELGALTHQIVNFLSRTRYPQVGPGWPDPPYPGYAPAAGDGVAVDRIRWCRKRITTLANSEHITAMRIGP